MSTHLYIEVDQTGSAFQVAISQIDEDGIGIGYRLYGPSYNGGSSPLFRVKLTKSDRAKIREYLDAQDALELRGESGGKE